MKRVAALFCLALVACSGGEEPEEDDKKDQPEPVSVVAFDRAQLGSVSLVLTSSAVVESEAAADLVPEANGVVLKVFVEEGDVVKKGQLLATIDNISYSAGAERTTAEVRRLERQVKTSEQLRSQGAISERELDDLRYQLSSARTNAREARGSLGQTRMNAPFDGVVARRDARIGELTGPSKVAFQIVDLNRLRVITQLPERDLARVKIGQSARLVSAYNSESWSAATVKRVAPVVDASTGTFRVTLELDSDQNRLRPGQFVSVELEVDRHVDVLVVPKSALTYEAGRPIIYKSGPLPEKKEEDASEEEGGEGDEAWWWPFGGDEDDEEGDAKPTKDGEEEEKPPPKPEFAAVRAVVELGLVDSNVAEVVSGLEEGDQIVVIGQSHLKEGALLRSAPEKEEANNQNTENEEPKEAHVQ